MKFQEFESSLENPNPPAGLSALLDALWFEACGFWRESDWKRAHQIVQDEVGAEACQVHAYLHRREGDLPNARYWYGRAGVEPRVDELEAEWADLVRALLGS